MRKENSRQHTLCFPSLITRLLERVKSKKKNKRLANTKPHTGELELRIWESRGGKDNPCDEAKEKVFELKAIREAMRGTPKKSKFASPSPNPVLTSSTSPNIQTDVETIKKQVECNRTDLEKLVHEMVDRRIEEKSLNSSIKFLIHKILSNCGG